MTDVIDGPNLFEVAAAPATEVLAAPETPPNPFSDVARLAVSQLLERTPLPMQLHIGEITRAAFDGQKLPRDKFRTFCDAVNDDPRLTYLGSARLAVNSEAVAAYEPEAATRHTSEVTLVTDSESTGTTMSLERMIRRWRDDAPGQRRKPHSRKRVHFKKGTAMSGVDLDDYDDSDEY